MEAGTLSYQQFALLNDALSPQVELVPLNDGVESLRMIKDAAEIKNLQQAVTLNDKAFAYMKNVLTKTPKLKACRLALLSEIFIKQAGSSGFAFDPIIAFGKDSGMPHAAL